MPGTPDSETGEESLSVGCINNRREDYAKATTEGEPGENENAVAGGKNRAYISVAILCLINLLNYMDRFTIAGILPSVQGYYGVGNSEGGLLQTSFVCSYMIFAPIFGYLGDRYNRKIIMVGGILFWSCTTLVGSFIPAEHFWVFLMCRGLVGVGEASYSTIAPTIIADLFLGTARSKMLAIFYFAIPVGSGLGYIVGSNVAKLMGSWHWALRVTPALGVFSVILMLVALKDPPRGISEGGEHLTPTHWTVDLKELCKNRSFMWSTLGFTCVAFVAGALAWWGPTFLDLANQVQGKPSDMSTVSLIFGVVTVVAGVVGVASGSGAASYLKRRFPRADPLVCAFGMILSTPFLFFASILSKYSTVAAYILIFIGETLLCLTWAIVADILLYVVIPTRRSMAEAIQILVSHALGDAGSPYIIGVVSEALKGGLPANEVGDYTSLLYALFITCFISVVGGLAFIITAWYVVDDKKKADMAVKGIDGEPAPPSDSPQLTMVHHGGAAEVSGQNGDASSSSSAISTTSADEGYPLIM